MCPTPNRPPPGGAWEAQLAPGWRGWIRFSLTAALAAELERTLRRRVASADPTRTRDAARGRRGLVPGTYPVRVAEAGDQLQFRQRIEVTASEPGEPRRRGRGDAVRDFLHQRIRIRRRPQLVDGVLALECGERRRVERHQEKDFRFHLPRDE